jgi:uncharacterized protein with HEPN domain
MPHLDLTALRLAIQSFHEGLGVVQDEAWFSFRQMRNITAHTYDHAKAQQVYLGTQSFLTQARQLLGCLADRGKPDA